ncbi:hypothetical protein AYM40_36915 (plasmid) [Paraburkholderia phytofirmans OLGA172]|uniref:Uncharacterized protein n=1 Tax=Paraburkholderia phytofirmans OLGA172 TaxID=1417228 RepID=A0A160FX95_9BURK|nr:hypothetical protein [Paraburkholderia phytofirmans]ANB77924.1 hypothetical protein AYM40_36915 [Paraburkholderia phytofirmans OLGA172]
MKRLSDRAQREIDALRGARETLLNARADVDPSFDAYDVIIRELDALIEELEGERDGFEKALTIKKVEAAFDAPELYEGDRPFAEFVHAVRDVLVDAGMLQLATRQP